ncbi:dehydratase [Hahella sp. CCB-MM4]|uniref:MaoC family dehydratase n=1 Tax=Hahella sp. (strain CCB-MM4) TaxID=1926491 RepID=UPI000B9B45B1|nr:MaoC family dehydratase [Hahella sp. CCB-MM4]OZG73342.1 dehydratase [Hahella sp. CCB-MM4]
MKKNITELSVGDELGISPWFRVDQERIDAFADVTGDHQWIHVDRIRASQESPFGTTIAHGFLTTTLMPSMFYDMIDIDSETMTLLNYGTDKIRFLEPVRSGDEIRYKIKVEDRQQKASGTLFSFGCEVEIHGREKPAMVAIFLMLLV